MSKHSSNSNRFIEFLSGKGFYIILILCVAAIGVSGYMLFFSGDSDNSSLDYMNDDVNSNDSSLDRIALPTLPGTIPNLDNALTLDDLPVAAITTIPRPSSPKPSPAVPSAPVLSLSPSPSPSPVPSPSPSAKAASKLPAVFVWPVKGAAVNAFSADDLVFNKTMGDWRVHMGLDIECAMGTQVAAVADGTVKDIYEDVFLGTTVVIEHSGGLTSVYSNLLKKPTVSISEKVNAGQVIGGVGQTAEGERREVNHLHLQMLLNKTPVNPANYLPKE